MTKLYKRFVSCSMFICAFAIPNLKLSGMYSDGDPKVFSLITSDEKRTNYRLSNQYPEGVVVIKPDTGRNERDKILVYATIDEERFLKVSDPTIYNQRSIDKHRLTSLCDASLLAIIKAIITTEKYNCVGYKADMCTKELAAIIALLDEANRIREGITNVDAATTYKIEQLLSSKEFQSEHQKAMEEFKIAGSITSQKIKQVTRGDNSGEGMARSPRFLAR